VRPFFIVVVHILQTYADPQATLFDLGEAVKRLRKAQQSTTVCKRRSVKSDEPKTERKPSAECKLGEQKVRLLIKQYQEGTNAKDLAVRFDISLNSVKRLLKKYGGRLKDMK